jgi:hypothetical protein
LSKIKEATNPFYAVLLVRGIVFVVSACLYGVMMVQTMHPTGPASPVIAWMEAYGNWLLAGETVVLAVLTFGAIGTDGYWTKKPAETAQNPESGESSE